MDGTGADAHDLAASAAWPGEPPDISVVVSTYRRAAYLADLVAALEAQTLDHRRFEVVMVDNGSADDTWSTLTHLAARTSMRLQAVRLEGNRGPGGGRNAGIAVARAALVAITDDDCLPTPTWLAELVRAFDDGAAVVQAPVLPDPDPVTDARWWDHTITITGPSPWFETSNVAYRASYLTMVGGFDETDPLTSQQGGGRAFGEDAVLGARVVAAGGTRAWAPDAVVHHRVVPSSFRRQLHEWRNLKGFPGLVERSAVGEATLFAKVFLNRDTARFDLALAGVVLAVFTRRPWPLAAVYPWWRARVGWARGQAAGPAELLVRMAQRGLIEAVGFVSLVEGSVRHRRVVL